MVDDATRRQFGAELDASHRRYQGERDRQHDIYMRTCKGEQTTREKALRGLDPRDQAGISIAHDLYDGAARRATRIYERYEARAWKRHEAEAAELRAKYGIEEIAE